MLPAILIGFFAGTIATNGIPHFVKGITGQRHMTPFGQPSSALANVVWGWMNFVVAGSIWSQLDTRDYEPAFIAAALGSLTTAAALSSFWSKHPEKNNPKE